LEPIILASQSPRRRELLARLDIPFIVDAPSTDEHCLLPPGEAVMQISCRKAAAAAVMNPGKVILAADTLVSLNGLSLGKPANYEDAFRMLRMLSGQQHQVYTGVTVITKEGLRMTEVDQTDVTFCEIPEKEIAAYIASGEPLDKAGAYALQGKASAWVSHIEGSDTSVIGLPLYLVRRMLIQAGCYVLNESCE
jgi:septum formation protein